MKNKIFLKFLILGAVLTLIGIGIFRADEQDSISLQGVGLKTLNAGLVAEFNDSYVTDASPVGKIVDFDLTASISNLKLPNGKVERLFAYNNQIPGPSIRIKLGETLRLNFNNKLPEETTVHFHGVRVPNAMDGVPGVTQSAIKQNESFVYEFTPKDAGTYWYHPHVRTSEQLEKGLYGILIVEEENPNPYTQDITWVLDDWRLDRSGGLDENFNTGHDLMHDGRWGQYITVNGSLDEVLEVHNGERIRLRLINVSNARIYKPVFPNLTAMVIAVDGMRVADPFVYTGLDLSPGNRLDLDIIIQTDTNEIVIVDEFTRSKNKLATIRIDSELVQTPEFELKNYYVPSWVNANQMPVDAELRLNARRGGQYGIEWTINNKVFGEHTPLDLELGKFHKIRLTNESGRLHPMHLHGQFFKVLVRNGVPVSENFWRDTVLVKSKEVVDVGIVPMDEGNWVNHCHILEHAEAGMVTEVRVQ